MLKNLIISNIPLDPKTPPHLIRKRYRHFTVSSIEELAKYKDKYWIWAGPTNRCTPVYAGKSVVRQLYSLLRIDLSNTNWRVHALPNVPRWDVNPFRYKLANGYEAAYDADAPPPASESSDIEDLVDIIPDYWEKDEMPNLETIYNTLGGNYERTVIEEASKILGRTIPL